MDGFINYSVTLTLLFEDNQKEHVETFFFFNFASFVHPSICLSDLINLLR